VSYGKFAILEKKGDVGCSLTCPHYSYAAKFHSYQQRRLLTVHGEVHARRAYYYCGRCQQSFLPYDDALGLVDEISPGLMPLVCLADVTAVCRRRRGFAQALLRSAFIRIDGTA
jgi:hypothetical protein